MIPDSELKKLPKIPRLLRNQELHDGTFTTPYRWLANLIPRTQGLSYARECFEIGCRLESQGWRLPEMIDAEEKPRIELITKTDFETHEVFPMRTQHWVELMIEWIDDLKTGDIELIYACTIERLGGRK